MKTLILASLAILVAAPLRAEIGGAVKIEHDQAVAARRAARQNYLHARPIGVISRLDPSLDEAVRVQSASMQCTLNFDSERGLSTYGQTAIEAGVRLGLSRQQASEAGQRYVRIWRRDCAPRSAFADSRALAAPRGMSGEQRARLDRDVSRALSGVRDFESRSSEAGPGGAAAGSAPAAGRRQEAPTPRQKGRARAPEPPQARVCKPDLLQRAAGYVIDLFYKDLGEPACSYAPFHEAP